MKPDCRKDSAHREHRCRRLAAVQAILPLCAVALLAGCRTLANDGDGLLARTTRPVTDAARMFWTGDPERKDRKPQSLADAARFDEAGRAALEQANSDFDAGRYAAAAKQYRKIARKYQETSVGEEAQFRLAECLFAQKRYPAAQDAYEQLFADYTSTRFVKTASRRLYEIAQVWLDMSDPKHRSAIRTVSAVEIRYDDPDDLPPPPKDPTIRYRVLPNLHDRTRPVFDTQGRALKALKSIWLNDPLGPLADDALAMTARYYLRRKDYVEADRYFGILREEYPDSEYLREAHLLGSHVKLMSYQGPAYDGTTLEQADELIGRTLRLFPDAPERQQLRRDRQKMYLLKAQRIWEDVQYYEAKKSDAAVAITCIQLISTFPDTKFADMARDRLARIDPASVDHLPEVGDAIRRLTRQQTQPSSGRNVRSVSASRQDR